MKPHLEKLLFSKKKLNNGTLVGCYATETPDARTIYLQTIESLLCAATLWNRPISQWLSSERDAFLLIADEINDGAEIALCGELAKIMKANNLLPNN